MTFDSLTFARRLKTAGFSETQAEALADANRDMLVPHLATKDDLKSETASVRSEMVSMKQELSAEIEALGLRLTIRLGVMLAAAISLMTAISGVLLRSH